MKVKVVENQSLRALGMPDTDKYTAESHRGRRLLALSFGESFRAPIAEHLHASVFSGQTSPK